MRDELPIARRAKPRNYYPSWVGWLSFAIGVVCVIGGLYMLSEGMRLRYEDQKRFELQRRD